jgi:hypothetical protein
VKQILLCPSLPCNQICIAIQQTSNEDSFSKLNKIYKKKISKGKKHEKRKQPQEKSFTSGKKNKLTKSRNDSGVEVNPHFD